LDGSSGVPFAVRPVGVPAQATPPHLSCRPCITSALSHAREWIKNKRGEAEVELACAGLLRDAEDFVATEDKCSDGFSTLKLKVGFRPLREEQRIVSALIRNLSDIAPVRLRLDANGMLTPAAYAAWCDFLSEYPEVEWLEQPLPVGAENAMREIAEKAGVAGRIALDESACHAATLPASWPGYLAVKPLLLGELGEELGERGHPRWPSVRAMPPRKSPTISTRVFQ
jgi:O-succinylbenzoate synthase